MIKTLWEWEAAFIRLMQQIKATGIKVDKEFCKPRVIKGTEICLQLKNELGWNPGSSKQLAEFLIDKMGYPVVRRTPAGAPSMDKYALEEYDSMLELEGSDLAKKIVRYRGWQKTVSSNYKPYLELCDSDNILHPNYKVHGTVTGRLSCELPNLQQIPRSGDKEWNGDLKKAFIPRSSSFTLVEFDFSQLEFRLAAAYAKELELLEIFNSPNTDIFKEMANRLKWERSDVKTLVYATLYGAGLKRIAMIFSLSKEKAQERLDEFHSLWPGFKKISNNAQKLAEFNGYVEYWTGRRRHFDNKKDCHKAFNSVVQGGAFEIVKRQMLALDSVLTEVPIVLQVHDSVTLEMPKEYYEDTFLNMCRRILEDVPESKEMGVKFKVDHKIWGEK